MACPDIQKIPHYITFGRIFGGKKGIEVKMSKLTFSTLSSEIFLYSKKD
jgi:hypothetical protein